MMTLWQHIHELSNDHKYMSGIERTVSRVKATGEVFTPTELVIEIIQKVVNSDPDALGPGKSVLDPACGDGQFLVVAKWYKVLQHGMAEADALNDIYGVDIMRDNVDICKARLGGGIILMGDTLNPTVRLVDQTDEEHYLMIDLFTDTNTLESFFR